MADTPITPAMLVVLDGFGHRTSAQDNAILAAGTPFLDSLAKRYPHTLLSASGGDVGLPGGQMGNSEVGHMNLGAGRVAVQDLDRINRAVADGAFAEQPELRRFLEAVKATGGALHLMGLCSSGGVHSALEHLYAAVAAGKASGIGRIYVHAILDGRDTPPSSAAGFVANIEAQLGRIGAGVIATAAGRFYTMDRDKRWDRVERAYRNLTEPAAFRAATAVAGIEASYAKGVTDEFVEPFQVATPGGGGLIGDGDGVFFFNFRSDRAREITMAFTAEDFPGFARRVRPKLAAYLCMTQYKEDFHLPVVFPPQTYPNTMGEVVAAHGLAQLRIAETEKYAHVTFFFNGGVEAVFPGEERILVPSPKDVPTYDLKPEMSAREVTSRLVQALQSKKFHFVLVNYANPDMVGHTGVWDAAVRAVTIIDACLRETVTAAFGAGYDVYITADHGNIELMKDPETGQPHTAHTTNLVPFIMARQRGGTPAGPGILADVAPTILAGMGLPAPPEMTGRNLLP